MARLQVMAVNMEVDQTDGEGDREALDRAGTEAEQHHGGDQGGDVGVDDGRQGLVDSPRRCSPGASCRCAISSRMRSKISTLASTAIPIVSTMPAMPGMVRVAPSMAQDRHDQHQIQQQHQIGDQPEAPGNRSP